MLMPWGKHKGTDISELPDDYLEWLHGLDDLKPRLRQFVDSEYDARFSPDPGTMRDIVNAGYRTLSMKYHPDHGGDTEVMKQLNNSVAELRNWLEHQKK